MHATVTPMTHSPHFDIYVASCTPTGGIYHYKMSGSHLELGEMTPMDRPMYMVIQGNKMYIVLRAPFEDWQSGVVVYDIDDSGKLVNPSDIYPTKGEVACHILVDEEQIYCANYTSGSLIRLPDLLVQHSGSGMYPDRQEGPHVHFVGLTPDNQYVCVADLGLDTIFLYTMDLKLHSSAKVPAGHGVRHLAFSEDGKYLFAANELKSTVAAFEYRDGNLKLLDVCSAIPDGFTGETFIAAIRVRGERIYVSNRGHDSVAVLRFDGSKLHLLNTFPCGGQTPRDFCFAGKYLLCANQDSNSVTILDEENCFQVKASELVKMPICVCAEMREEYKKRI